MQTFQNQSFLTKKQFKRQNVSDFCWSSFSWFGEVHDIYCDFRGDDLIAIFGKRSGDTLYSSCKRMTRTLAGETVISIGPKCTNFFLIGKTSFARLNFVRRVGRIDRSLFPLRVQLLTYVLRTSRSISSNQHK
jgi:hypothetical protein